MRFLLVVFGIGLYTEIASSESGDCENLENPAGRNIIHSSVEIDPCGPVIFKKCITSEPPDQKCNVTLRPNKPIPFKLLIKDYDIQSKTIKFSLTLPKRVEFFIEVHAAQDDDGTYDPNSEKLGSFADVIFPSCNSYACCDKVAKARQTVARKCTNTSSKPTPLPFYTISYLWSPPADFQGDVVFVAAFSQISDVHYEGIKSDVYFVGPFKKSRQPKAPVPPKPIIPRPTQLPAVVVPSLTTPKPSSIVVPTSSTLVLTTTEANPKSKTLKPAIFATTTVATPKAIPTPKAKEIENVKQNPTEKSIPDEVTTEKPKNNIKPNIPTETITEKSVPDETEITTKKPKNRKPKPVEEEKLQEVQYGKKNEKKGRAFGGQLFAGIFQNIGLVL